MIIAQKKHKKKLFLKSLFCKFVAKFKKSMPEARIAHAQVLISVV
jgi:hypothetical protein